MNSKMKSLSAMLTALLSLSGPVVAGVNVPAGFEELAQGQTIWVDVSLYGSTLGLFQAKIDLQNVTFLQPGALTEAVRKNYSDAPLLQAKIQRSLRVPLKRNGNLACSDSRSSPGCGFISTDSVAVIYDENNARISLFLAPEFLPKARADDGYYEATTDSHNALVHQQNVNFVADRRYQSGSVQGNGSLGVIPNGWLNVDWSWQGQRYGRESLQQTRISNAVFRQDFLKRVYVQAGIMDSRDIFSNAGGSINLSQLPLGKIGGARVGSTHAWINQQKVAQGSPVSLFLSRDARVDAYRGDQLLTSFYLRPGAQTLDTRTFPLGSYAVTLRIFEDNRLVRTQTQPFTSTGNVQLNSFQWFVQGGTLGENGGRDIKDNSQVMQGGIRIPLTATISLTAGSALLRDARYWESAIDWSQGFNSGPLDGVLSSRLSYLHGSDGSRGNIQQVSYSDGFSLSVYRSAIHANDCNSRTDTRYGFSGCYQSTNMMLSLPFAQWNTSLSYLTNSNEGRYTLLRDLSSDEVLSRGGARWQQVYTSRSRSHSWQVGLSRYFAVNRLNVNTSVSAFTRRDSSFKGTDNGVFATFSLSRSSSGDEPLGFSSLGANWQSSRYGDDRLSYNAAWNRYIGGNGENEVGASLYGINARTATASAWGRAGGQYGNGTLTLSDSWDSLDSRSMLSSSGSYSSSLVADSQGVLWGRWGDGSPAAAVALSVATAEEESSSQVDVAIDGGGRANVSSNSRAVFTFPGYRQTTLRVNESVNVTMGTGSEITRGARARPLFMTPGRIYRHDVDVATRYIWMGSMVDEQHRPLDGVIPLNVPSWTALGNGGFTLETTRGLSVLYVMRENSFWQCTMIVKTRRDVVRWVGTLRCQSTEMARLPAAEKKQVALMTPRHNHATARAD